MDVEDFDARGLLGGADAVVEVVVEVFVLVLGERLGWKREMWVRGICGVTYLCHGAFEIEADTWIVSIDYTFGLNWEFETRAHVLIDQMADLGLDLECCVLIALNVE